jgi:hypothetical protein
MDHKKPAVWTATAARAGDPLITASIEAHTKPAEQDFAYALLAQAQSLQGPSLVPPPLGASGLDQLRHHGYSIVDIAAK